MNKGRVFLLLSSVIACLVFIILMLGDKLYFDNDKWLFQDNTHQQQLDRLKNEFESDDNFIIGIKLKDTFFSNDNINQFKEITSELETIKSVKSIESPLEVTYVHQDLDSVLYTETFQHALDNNRMNLKSYQSHFLKSDYFGKFLSEEQKVAIILLKLKQSSQIDRQKTYQQLVDKVEYILNKYPTFNDNFYCGDIYLNFQMNDSTKQNARTLLPILFALMIMLLLAVFRSFIKTFVVILPTLFCLILTQICLILLNHPLTIINITLIILILVISIADSIHIINRFQYISNNNDQSVVENIKLTIQQTWLPCFITTITTAIGFGSFYLSDIVPLRNYGVESFLVILLSYLLIFLVSIGAIYFTGHYLVEPIKKAAH